MACLGVIQFTLLHASPGHAAAYLNTSDISPRCATETALGCVEVGSATAFTVFGKQNSPDTDPTIASFGPQSSTYTATFFWDFESANDMTAFYSNGIDTFNVIGSGSGSIQVIAGQSLTFGVDTGSTYDVPILRITSFETVEAGPVSGPQDVPAPLPALGAFAAFGAISRRGAALRKASATLKASRRQ